MISGDLRFAKVTFRGRQFTEGEPQFRETFHGILQHPGSPPRMRGRDRFIFAVERECVQARVERLNYPIRPVVFLPVP